MIEKTHEHCATCDWLGREAERTSKELGRDHWASETTVDGTIHAAYYTEEDQ